MCCQRSEEGFMEGTSLKYSNMSTAKAKRHNQSGDNALTWRL